MTEEWFEERLRKSEEFNPENMTTKQILKEHLGDTDPSVDQITAINQKAKEQLADKFDNSVTTKNAVELSERFLTRDPERDTGVMVKTTQGLKALDSIGGIHQSQGTKYVRDLKGRVMGALEE